MCGCGSVVNPTLSKSNWKSNSCSHLYNEMLDLIYKSSQILKVDYTEMMADAKSQVYNWLVNYEKKCPEEGEYNTIKTYIESEYTIHFT